MLHKRDKIRKEKDDYRANQVLNIKDIASKSLSNMITIYTNGLPDNNEVNYKLNRINEVFRGISNTINSEIKELFAGRKEIIDEEA